MTNVQQIERAIETLSPRELEELFQWLEENRAQRADALLRTNLADGQFDEAIFQALEEEKSGLIKPLE